VSRLDWLFAEPEDARAAAHELIGATSVRGSLHLRTLGRHFHVEIPVQLADLTLAELFAAHFDDAPHIGDRIEVGIATLVVQSIADERVSRVGLLLGPPGELRLGLPPGMRGRRLRAGRGWPPARPAAGGSGAGPRLRTRADPGRPGYHAPARGGRSGATRCRRRKRPQSLRPRYHRARQRLWRDR